MVLQTLHRYSRAIAWSFYLLFCGESVFAFSARERRMYYPAMDNHYEGGVDRVGAEAFLPKAAEPLEPRELPPVAVKQVPKEKKAFGGGPTQPEMQSFQSVNSNNMVDLFSGDFAYNIPLLDVGGYPVNLHYQSGISMDQEASWVGLGWNINPGAITRNMRGLPDDFNGSDQITKTISMKEDKTMGVTAAGNAELVGYPVGGNLGFSLGVFHNTYKGWGTETGINAGINAGIGSKGNLSGGLNITNNSQSGLDVSPTFSYSLASEDNKSRGNISIGTNYNSRMGIQNLQLTAEVKQTSNSFNKERFSGSAGTSISSYISFASPSYTPKISIPFTSTQYTFKAKLGTAAWFLHPNLNVTGYASTQKIAPEDQVQTVPAYGYMYYQNAGPNQHVLLDFNRDKEVTYRENVPNIGVPSYTYDTYSISGEGTGGMFRPYRGDIGYVFDHSMSTKSNSATFTIDLGFGNIFHGGVDVNKVDAGTHNGAWTQDNLLKDVIGWRNKDSVYENVYFKNPGEKTLVNQSFFDSLGDDNLVRVDLDPLNGQNTPVVTAGRNLSVFKNAKFLKRTPLTFTNTIRKERDKRNQLISWLRADQVRDGGGLEKTIRTYDINKFPCGTCNINYKALPRVGDIRQPHHISEITVNNTDGKRYVYGVPVYNINQSDVSFATNPGNNTTGLVSYNQDPAHPENSVNNNRGKDNYFNKDQTPAYAHSFLLSAILSPDYVDVTGDGVTDDDMGEAVHFNYSRVYGTDNNGYQWRAPFFQNQASYNEGLKTDSRDERGNYSYGTKEIWYLNSLESKTYIATFTLETDSVRQDGFAVLNENGGLDVSRKLYRLKQIDLYTKSDFIKNGVAKAKSIKTVHFDYDYSLCPGNPGSNGSTTGKLTLRRVWFSYNNNNKGRLNPYVFSYHANNPAYNNKSYDRWGNYKDPVNNPGVTGKELSNADYCYSLQPGVKSWDSTQASNSVSAWALTGIKLPAGGRIGVDYESDDYAFVQNRRAMQMFTVLGFGQDATSPVSTALYNGTNNDYRFVFIRITDPVATRADITRKYLEGVSRLYFKLLVTVPSDRWGSGSEFVPCFADIEDYGIKGVPTDNVIWIRVAAVNGHSPMAESAIQFLRLNLPSKAYPFSEPGDNISAADAIKMILTAGANVIDAINGFDASARKRNWCNSISPDRSFVRLDNPIYKKFGGGLRVKRIRVYDNWNAMTHQKESVYGQEFDYSTTVSLNGVDTRISSGVATYEPSIGKEESPFYLPVEYVEKTSALAPTNYLYTEEPLQESFYPSPMVGYRKVRVQTIHRDKKSADGLEETEFYTAYDFPTLSEFTPLDIQSKKTYNPKIANFFKFDAKHDVTLSQGFKVELNDMNGKIRSQSSYAQTDLVHPMSYTYNYYKLDNDNAAVPHLNNMVTVADSANGGLITNGQIGKDVEMMVDCREQVSNTASGSVEVNVDVTLAGFFPIGAGSAIPFPTSERNRFRSVAVMKVVQRYGILDSVVHFDKGSLVSSRNLVYDGETGEALLFRTGNLYNDPVYNFTYPAHWAYSGMEPGYKNIGTQFSGVNFRQGRMYYRDGTLFPSERYFQGGDEILVYGRNVRFNLPGVDICNPAYYFYLGPVVPQKIWAADLSSGQEKYKGIYFIDKDGKPFSGANDSLIIVRSGKRNMSETPVGSVISLANPIRSVGGGSKIVFDSTTSVITAVASRFSDLWRTDSTLYRKDTTMILPRLADTALAIGNPVEAFMVESRNGGDSYAAYPNTKDFAAESVDLGRNHSDHNRKTWLRWDLWTPSYYSTGVPQGAVIKSSSLFLPADRRDITGPPAQPALPDVNNRNTTSGNSSWLSRTKGIWYPDVWRAAKQSHNIFLAPVILLQMFQDNPNMNIDQVTRVSLPSTPFNQQVYRDDQIDITAMTQGMVDDYYASNKKYPAATMIELKDASGNRGDNMMSRLAYYSGFYNGAGNYQKGYLSPQMNIVYCLPCQNGLKPTYSNTPVPGYYCYSKPVDTFICKPNINDTAVNPYRWGILGSWRAIRSYVYYGSRNDSDATVTTTNIRTDGQIRGFVPFWALGSGKMQPSTDSGRWVWNSQLNQYNRRGYEVEDNDPLGRYNAGQYGYNSTLPVAVTQNSRNREMVYDGFEDYGYKTDTCSTCPPPRFADFTKGGGTLVDSSSHTGIYSLRLAGNTTSNIVFPVVTRAADTISATLSMRTDSTALVHTSVTGKGHGLKVEYRMFAANIFMNPGCLSTPKNTWIAQAGAGNVDFNWLALNPRPFCPANYFNIRWTGAIQPRYSEVYTFHVQCDDYVTVYINDGSRLRQITNKRDPADNLDPEVPHTWNKEYETDTITLQAGRLYSITVQYTQQSGNAFAHLSWSSPSQVKEIVPLSQLYLPTWTTTDTAGSFKRDTTWCVTLRNIKPTKVVRPGFSPLQGTKILVGAWVKEDLTCITGSYTNEKVVVTFSTGASFTLKPSGNIIEGWQRIEDTLTIPATATTMTFSMQTTTGTAVFFDDIRLHPFSGDMKSYAYSPINLRLMAELDENNYATFYEYDDDGTLTRVKKETERGIMTVKETRAALMKDQ